MPTVPRLKGSEENSAGILGRSESAHPGAGGIARLRHETVDHPMEDEAIVEAALRQGLDLGHMFGGEIGPQQNRDPAVLGVKIDRVLEVLRRRAGAAREIEALPKAKPKARPNVNQSRSSSGKASFGSILKQLIELSRARRLASACATAAGTKADTSPPRPAICRTNVALM